MQKSIRDTIQYLCDKHGMQKPKITVECRDELIEVYAEIHYDVEYDVCEIKISYADSSPLAEITRCIAHEFSHYITMDIMRLRALLVPKLEHDALVDALFVQAIEVIAQRLEPMFIKEIEELDKWMK